MKRKKQTCSEKKTDVNFSTLVGTSDVRSRRSSFWWRRAYSVDVKNTTQLGKLGSIT
jgi:hypothetical protein